MKRDLLDLKKRLQQKTANPKPVFRCVVKHHNAMVSEHAFDQEVVKVGTLPSSHIQLAGDDTARMHAVLERSANVWRVIDLGSLSGTYLDGELVSKNAVLPKEGTLSFGSFDVQYVLGPTSVADIVQEVAKEEFEKNTSDHHKKMMEGLMAELEKMAPQTHRSASFMQKGWHLLDDQKKRKYLRMMVDTLRESREESRKFSERSAAAIMAMGPEGLASIYDLTPEEAVAKARETLTEMSQAKQSLALLRDMSLMEGVQQGIEAMSKLGPDEIEQLAKFKRGHEALAENLEVILASGSTILLACLSRAGGAELSGDDRAKMKAQWDAALSGAKSK